MGSIEYSTYAGLEVASNELFSNFKYTPLEGFDYQGGDGTLSRRDATKIIRVNGTYDLALFQIRQKDCGRLPTQ